MARKLTAGERHMIGTVFPAGIVDLEPVRLIKEEKPDFEMMNNYAYVGYNNDIRFLNPGASFKCWYSEDFSKENNFFYRTLLIHEIAHIWQIQAQIPCDDDFDYAAINDPFLSDEASEHTKQHLDLFKSPSVGSIKVKGEALEFHRPYTTLSTIMVNNYMTLRGPLSTDHVTPEMLQQSWMRRRAYNHSVHDLSKTMFWEMNQEEQAEVIVDYFCLVHGRSPEMERYLVSTHKRPPIEVYRKIIPFLW